MKMIIAILSDQNSQPVIQALVQADFRATRIASTGAFLRKGSSTLLIGVEDGKVDEAFQAIRSAVVVEAEPGQKHVKLFVLNVDQFIHI